MYDVEKLYVEKESLDARGLSEEDLSVDVEILPASDLKNCLMNQRYFLISNVTYNQ